jgi:hypothetical protein
MEEDKIREVFDKISVTPSIKNKVLNSINSERLSNQVTKKHSSHKRLVCVAITTVLIFGILLKLNLINTDKNHIGQFIITASAANGEELILTENAEVLLPEYSVFMSSTIGYPIRINFNNTNGTDEIQIITEGAKIFGENGKLDYQNNQFICHEGDTIYWMPVLDSEEKFSSDFTMKILALKDDKIVGQTEVLFISNKDPKRLAWSAKIIDID